MKMNVKIKIFSIVLLLVLLMGTLVSNAASATLTFNIFYSKGVISPSYYYLDGISFFTLTSSDIKKNFLGMTERKLVEHKIFASDDYKSFERYMSNYSSGQEYKETILTPDDGGNYGGDRAYVAIQSATFTKDIEYGMFQTIKVSVGMTTSIGDTWCKEEIFAHTYGGDQKFVKSLNLADAKQSGAF